MNKKRKKKSGFTTAMEYVFAFSAMFLLFYCGLLYVPKLWGIETLAVTSGSMEPTISKGSLVFVDTSDKKLEIGKVMTYHASEDPRSMLVTHRVYEIYPDGSFKTKGDANQTVDINIIGPSQIVGADVWTIDKFGYLTSSTSIVIIPFAIMIASGIILAFSD